MTNKGKRKPKSNTHRRITLLKRLVLSVLLLTTIGLIGANLFYASLYLRPSIIHRQFPYVSIYNNGNKVCITTTLREHPPRFILPIFAVKFIINGETVPIWNMSIDFDYNGWSFDLFEYRGDIVCSGHNLEPGTHNLEVVEISYTHNLSYSIPFQVFKDGSIRYSVDDPVD